MLTLNPAGACGTAPAGRDPLPPLRPDGVSPGFGRSFAVILCACPGFSAAVVLNDCLPVAMFMLSVLAAWSRSPAAKTISPAGRIQWSVFMFFRLSQGEVGHNAAPSYEH